MLRISSVKVRDGYMLTPAHRLLLQISILDAWYQPLKEPLDIISFSRTSNTLSIKLASNLLFSAMSRANVLNFVGALLMPSAFLSGQQPLKSGVATAVMIWNIRQCEFFLLQCGVTLADIKEA
eukprot:g31041.t1